MNVNKVPVKASVNVVPTVTFDSLKAKFDENKALSILESKERIDKFVARKSTSMSVPRAEGVNMLLSILGVKSKDNNEAYNNIDGAEKVLKEVMQSAVRKFLSDVVSLNDIKAKDVTKQ